MIKVGQASYGYRSRKRPNPARENCLWREIIAKESPGKKPVVNEDKNELAVVESTRRPRRHSSTLPALGGYVLLAPGMQGSCRRGDKTDKTSRNGRTKPDTSRSTTSKGSARSISSRSDTSRSSLFTTRSDWSLSSFNTQDTGFTYNAAKKMSSLELALAEERKKRVEAEQKLDKLAKLLDLKL